MRQLMTNSALSPIHLNSRTPFPSPYHAGFRLVGAALLLAAQGKQAAAKAEQPAAPAPQPHAEQPDIIPKPWLVQSGVGLRFLSVSVGDKQRALDSDYSTNPETAVSGGLGYQGFVLSGSIAVGNVLPSETYGVSNGFTLFAGYDFRLFDRQLLISVIAQDYRGTYQQDPDTKANSKDYTGPLSLESAMRSYFYEVSTTYYLNRSFSFADTVQRVARRRLVSSWYTGLAYAIWGAENAVPRHAMIGLARRFSVTSARMQARAKSRRSPCPYPWAGKCM
jgi:hypothetical protein